MAARVCQPTLHRLRRLRTGVKRLGVWESAPGKRSEVVEITVGPWGPQAGCDDIEACSGGCGSHTFLIAIRPWKFLVLLAPKFDL